MIYLPLKAKKAHYNFNSVLLDKTKKASLDLNCSTYKNILKVHYYCSNTLCHFCWITQLARG